MAEKGAKPGLLAETGSGTREEKHSLSGEADRAEASLPVKPSRVGVPVKLEDRGMIRSILSLNYYLLFTPHLALKKTADDLDKIHLMKQKYKKYLENQEQRNRNGTRWGKSERAECRHQAPC